jgi:hypothetical protein
LRLASVLAFYDQEKKVVFMVGKGEIIGSVIVLALLIAGASPSELFDALRKEGYLVKRFLQYRWKHM